MLTQTLTDASLESRAAGWEILRVLTAEEEADFCVHLYRSDVLSAVENASKQVCAVDITLPRTQCSLQSKILETVKSTNPPFEKATKAQQRFMWEMTSSILSLLNILAEARDEILEPIAKNTKICDLLFFLVTSHVAPGEVLEDVLLCLITLSEDSRHLAEALVDDQTSGCFPALMKAKESGGAECALACALLHNIFSVLEWHDDSPGRDGACDAKIGRAHV